MVAVTESDPGSDGPLPFPFSLVITSPPRQWNVTLRVAPERTVPAAVPSFELSSAAWFAIVTIEPPAGGMGEVTVLATGPPLVLEQTVLAVGCWYWDTAIRSAWRTELVV